MPKLIPLDRDRCQGRHARQVIHWEQAIGLFQEARIQSWFLPHHLIVELWDVWYGTIHFVIPPLALVLLSPLIRPGTTSTVDYNHYSLLRTVEDIFGLPHLGDAAIPQVRSFGPDVFG